MNAPSTNIYRLLNELAKPNGIVILGGSEDCTIPLCELKQAFSLDMPLYNRSLDGLHVDDAAAFYEESILPLYPDTLLLHLGAADLEGYNDDPSGFDHHYRKLLETIQSKDHAPQIVVVSLQNPENDSTINELNRHLKYIAEAERCEYVDISSKPVWNPRATRDVMSFLYSTGFVRPLKQRRPVFDLVKILFCYA